MPCIAITINGELSWAALGATPLMTLKIERARAQIRLSGEFRSEHLDQVRDEIELCGSPAALDLQELDLIDVEAVRFLNVCEANGISVVHGSPYIREWMSREKSQPEAGARARKRGASGFGK